MCFGSFLLCLHMHLLPAVSFILPPLLPIFFLLVLFLFVFLQIALVMGNGLLNEVLEANLMESKPAPDCSTLVPYYSLVLPSLSISTYLPLSLSVRYDMNSSPTSTSTDGTPRPVSGKMLYSLNYSMPSSLVISNNSSRSLIRTPLL